MARSDSALPAPIEPSAPSDLRTVLETPLLDLLDLPPRVAAFAYAEGLETIGDLARIAPEALLAERNLGRKSVSLTRRILEARTGVSWEDIASPERGRAASPPPEELDPHGWDGVRRDLRDEHRRIPLVALDLPPGLRRRLAGRGIVTLGDLSYWSSARLLAVPGIGEQMVKKLATRASIGLDALATEYREADRPLLGAFVRAVDELEEKRRYVVRARSGLEGRPRSLTQIAASLGLSRERVRQLEERAAFALRGRPWAKHAGSRVEVALTDGPAPFAFFANDPWWATACEQPSVVAFVVERVLDGLAHVVEFDGAHWLSDQSRADLEDTWAVLHRAALRLSRPASDLEVDVLLALAVERIGPCRHVMDRFRERVLVR